MYSNVSLVARALCDAPFVVFAGMDAVEAPVEDLAALTACLYIILQHPPGQELQHDSE